MHLPKYYAVIGKGDYLTINGNRQGIWEYLERQPSGWLCSVAVNRTIIPRDLPIFWDCGAVKYKNAEIPILGQTLVLLQALRGQFYQANGSQLIKYTAALPDSKITIPLCYCSTCTQMRQMGIETRSSGNRSANLARAAHNLGQLLLAHQCNG